MQRWFLAGVIFLGFWLVMPGQAKAQDYNLNKMFYYPYYYFPHNYWPAMTAPYPERPGAPYMKPPAYMAYPPFREPHWRHDLFERMSYYRGFHFWLDQF